MTIDRETVIRLAIEAAGEPEHSGWGDLYIFEPSELERFAALVLEHGRKPLRCICPDIDACETAMGCLGLPGAIQKHDRGEFYQWGPPENTIHGITNKDSSDDEL